MADPEKQLRKKTYVSGEIQGRLMGRLAGYWLLYHVMLWHAMFLYSVMRYRGELMAGGEPMSMSELYSQFAMTHYSLAVCALSFLPIVLWDMMRTTHRIAGPLVRFRNGLQALASGEKIRPIKLRKKDLLVEFQEAFNSYLKASGNALPEGDTERSAQGDAIPESQLLSDVEELRKSASQEPVGANSTH